MSDSQLRTEFFPQLVRERLSDVSTCTRVLVAYSGGPDSTALLHCSVQAQLDVPLTAVHVDHQLHTESADWVRHCQAQCDAFGVELLVRKVCVGTAGVSVEADARRARYAALRELMEPHAVLLTAHTLDDQAETVLLQLFRGAGVDGLAAMPRCAQFGVGSHLRPLLGITRAVVNDYVVSKGLKTLADPANTDDRFDRSYLRCEVMPRLASRWPGIVKTLSRASGHQADASALLRTQAQHDLVGVKTAAGGVSATALLSLDPKRRINVLRFWLRAETTVAPPSWVVHRVESELLGARGDAVPMVQWAEFAIRRYRAELHLTPQLSDTVAGEWPWQVPESVEFAHGRICIEPTVGAGLRLSDLQQDALTIGFRVGGETLRPAGSAHVRRLKSLFQEAAVEPWRRSRIPLIFNGNELVAVAGYWVAEGHQAVGDEPGLVLSFEDFELDL